MTVPAIKHPELMIKVSPGENTFVTIGKVTKIFRNNSMYDSIEEFMSLALVAESDDEFMSIVNKFLRVTNDD